MVGESPEDGPGAPSVPWGRLMGYEELAAMLHVRPRTPLQWRKRRLLPEPGRVISGVPLWDRADLVTWALATGRLEKTELAAYVQSWEPPTN